ncbi:unnamed protein product [Chondrus crispus]|uniref:Uncharacterized protein n=1 Tax=Chondrus crispus TaxID=2769 RepID=R7Q8H4_CHOCR|nr:unnamed protein product [Chondrus crispus]CDF33686.1 unnamed protein product [Chondrus crispus]|eukprot:XP_005713505.1 unnamed protein product [Chondrus crispus]
MCAHQNRPDAPTISVSPRIAAWIRTIFQTTCVSSVLRAFPRDETPCVSTLDISLGSVLVDGFSAGASGFVCTDCGSRIISKKIRTQAQKTKMKNS